MSGKVKVALTGNVALELIAPYFREAGFDVHGPDAPPLNEFAPDFIYDVTAHDATLAAETPGFYDARMKALAGCPYSIDGIRAIVDEFRWQVAAGGGARKVLAVDADNTLWDGILSEDGAENLVPRREFQDGLKALAAEGVVIVLLTKNDCPSDAAWATSPFALDFITTSRINWAPKAGNLLDACRELNLGVESVAFVDDNPHERAQMQAHLPSVAVAPWNGWDASVDRALAARQLLRRLREYFFSDVGVTDEDRLRMRDYAANTLRRSFDGYLEDLGLWVKPTLAAEADLDRLAQMAGKTNQFNATTIRRTRADFAALLSDPARRVYVFRAGDRFGEQGLVCYVVVEMPQKRITDFVMSCRAMGRTLEHFAWNHVVADLGGVPSVDFVATPKNRPFAEFRATLGPQMKTYFKEVR